MKKETSFGSMEIISEKPRIERMTFMQEGRSHTHDTEEHCYVLEGSGKVVGARGDEHVSKGDVCTISSNTDHWMIPEKTPFTLLIFYGAQ